MITTDIINAEINHDALKVDPNIKLEIIFNIIVNTLPLNTTSSVISFSLLSFEFLM